jgi:hypothetical protein
MGPLNDGRSVGGAAAADTPVARRSACVDFLARRARRSPRRSAAGETAANKNRYGREFQNLLVFPGNPFDTTLRLLSKVQARFLPGRPIRDDAPFSNLIARAFGSLPARSARLGCC